MIKRLALTATVTLMTAGSAATAMAAAHPSAARSQRAPAHHTRHRRAPTRSDPVVAFNQLLQQVVTAPAAQPATIHPTRTMAITQIAVYDAVNGIVGQGRPMLFRERGPRHASADATAAAAARTALDALLPMQRMVIDAFYAHTLAQMGSGVAVRGGVRFGERVARAVIADRAHDGASVTPPGFTPQPGPGEYQLTAPAFTAAGFTQTAHVTPFVLRSARQFRPAAPPTLSSPRYAADFNEVRSLGELESGTRTADETAVGRFWGAAPIWVPLANTANDPSYPGAHAEFSQAAATVLQDALGTDVFSFSLNNATVGITRTFDSFSQAADEASASRIFAGQHFRYDEDAGQTLGGQVASFVLDHAFGPARRGR